MGDLVIIKREFPKSTLYSVIPRYKAFVANEHFRAKMMYHLSLHYFYFRMHSALIRASRRLRSDK